MPYVKKLRRDELLLGFEDRWTQPQNPGDLNFILTFHINEYLKIQGKSYSTINDIIGALEGAKLEFYRRVAAPYEDTKIKENGDVY